MTRKLTALSILVALFFSSNAAQACCGAEALMGASLAGPITTLPGFLMPKRKTAVAINVNYVNNGRLTPFQIGEGVRAGLGDADDSHGTLRPSITVAHGITNDFTLFASLPYVFHFDIREFELDEGGKLKEEGNSIGWGDLSLMGMFSLYKNERTKQFLSGIAGIKLPTGNSDVSYAPGDNFGAQEQPSSGSFDPLFGAAYSKVFQNNVSFHTSALYRYTNEGVGNNDMGDVFSYNFAVVYPVHRFFEGDYKGMTISEKYAAKTSRELNFVERIVPEHIFGQELSWDLIFEANGWWTGAPEVDGVQKDNYGGNTLMLSPGVRMIVNNKWNFHANVGFPVMEILDEYQGGQDLQINLGFATAF